ncbi:MAG: hypothetical protein U0L17_02555 [Acutalibacteraceae bacterium]|nr:hypothetical protein [Acutalibacteraceae bacterium]
MERNTFSKFCLKLFLRLFCLDICCFVTCSFCITSSGSHLIRIFLQAACIIVMIAFVYPVCHKVGDLDAPLVNVGHRKYSPLKGLYAGLVATLPCLLSGIFLLISKFTGLFASFVNYYKIINSIFFPFLYSIMPVDYTISELPISSVIFSFLILAVIPIVCMFAYILGLERFSFSEKLLYKKKEN